MVNVRKRCWLALCAQSVLGIDLPCSAWAGMPTEGSSDSLGTNAMFHSLLGIRISPDGTFALVTDNHSLWSINISTASVIILVNSVPSEDKNPFDPYDLSISPDGSFALIADSTNHIIHRITISTSSVTTFAGQVGSPRSRNGIGTNAGFSAPYGISIAPNGEFALVTQNFLIRHLVISTGEVSCLAGHYYGSGEHYQGGIDDIGIHARFDRLTGVAISPDSSYALVTDWGFSTIRRIDISTATVTTLAGESGRSGLIDGIRTAHFRDPRAISISPDGSYALVVDANRIRYIVISTGEVRTLPTSKNITNAGISISPDGSYAWAVDQSGHQILYIDLTSLTRSEAPERAVVGLAHPSESSLTGDSSQPMAIPDLEMMFFYFSLLLQEAMQSMLTGVVLLILLCLLVILGVG
jgi:DNA-binding beta-propeller fold protein YncE